MKKEMPLLTTVETDQELQDVSGGAYSRAELAEAVELLNPGFWERPTIGNGYEQLKKIFGK